MKNILKVFNPIFKFGNFFGFYPFQFSHENRAQFSYFGVTYSLLLLFYWIIDFILFAYCIVDVRKQGSDLSALSNIITTFILTTVSISIILINFVHYQCFEKLMVSLWNFDMKVQWLKAINLTLLILKIFRLCRISENLSTTTFIERFSYLYFVCSYSNISFYFKSSAFYDFL